jgi:hypothetical protein
MTILGASTTPQFRADRADLSGFSGERRVI